ncbi:MAG: hypothetical protein GYA24_19545, partial [Candidatus Lokiarchaeota archaeon]|nr:hypothetical protein [Candidatus Lokiarchaeota archaeon]
SAGVRAFDESINEDVDEDEQVMPFDGVLVEVAINKMPVHTRRALVPNPAQVPSHLQGMVSAPAIERWEFEASLDLFAGQTLDSISLNFTSLNNMSNKEIYLTALTMYDSTARSDGDSYDLLSELATLAPAPTTYTFPATYGPKNANTGPTGGFIMHAGSNEMELSRIWFGIVAKRDEAVPAPDVNPYPAVFQVEAGNFGTVTRDFSSIGGAVDTQFLAPLALKIVHEDRNADLDHLDWTSLIFKPRGGTIDTKAIVARRVLTSDHYPAIKAQATTPVAWGASDFLPGGETLLDGWQFRSMLATPEPRGVTDSVRQALITQRWAGLAGFDADGNPIVDDPVDGGTPTIFMKPLGPGDALGTRLRYENIYMPYRPELSGTIALHPGAAGAASVRFTIEIRDRLVPGRYVKFGQFLSTYPEGYAGTLADQFQYAWMEGSFGYSAFTGSAAYWQTIFAGSNVDIIFGVDLVSGSASSAHAHWLNLTLTGWEQVFTISSMLPEGAIAKQFSNNFVYMYGYDINSKANMLPTADKLDIRVVDITPPATSFGDYEIKPLAGFLNVQRYGAGVIEPQWSDPALNDPATWNSVVRDGAFLEGDLAAGNDQSQLPLVADSLGRYNAWIRFKFDEDDLALLSRRTTTAMYQGFIQYGYTQTTDPSGLTITRLPAFDQKITVIVQPEHQFQFAQFYRVEPGWILDSPSNLHIPVNEREPDELASVTDSVVLSYRKE